MFPAALVAGLVLAGCENETSSDNSTANSRTVAFTGTVVWVPIETGFYGLRSDDGRQYEPLNLPTDFQVDGLRVWVRGVERHDLVSINMWGTILDILKIELLAEAL